MRTLFFTSIIFLFANHSFCQNFKLKKNGEFEFECHYNSYPLGGTDAYFYGTYIIKDNSILFNEKPSFIVTENTAKCLETVNSEQWLKRNLEENELLIVFQINDIKLNTSLSPRNSECVVNDIVYTIRHIDENNVGFFIIKKKPADFEFLIEFSRYVLEPIQLTCTSKGVKIKVNGASTTMGKDFRDCLPSVIVYKGKTLKTSLNQGFVIEEF